MTLIQVASSGLGAVVGLLASAIFAVILRRLEASNAIEAIKALMNLVVLSLGGGIADYAIFDYILQAGAISFYIAGYATVFLFFGSIVFISWLRR